MRAECVEGNGSAHAHYEVEEQVGGRKAQVCAQMATPCLTVATERHDGLRERENRHGPEYDHQTSKEARALGVHARENEAASRKVTAAATRSLKAGIAPGIAPHRVEIQRAHVTGVEEDAPHGGRTGRGKRR